MIIALKMNGNMKAGAREKRGVNELSGEIANGKTQGTTRTGMIGEGKATETNGEIGTRMSYNIGMLKKTEGKKSSKPMTLKRLTEKFKKQKPQLKQQNKKQRKRTELSFKKKKFAMRRP